MLEIHEIPVTPFLQNCTLLICRESGAAAVCDCGEAAPVLARAKDLGVEITLVLATHGHLDHIGGTEELLRATGAPFLFPTGDDFLRLSLPEQARLYGWGPVRVPEVSADLVVGKAVRIGAVDLEVRHCPGHTPGHMVLYDADGGQVIAGDVLFAGSVGRTDFPRGSWEQLEHSIRTQLYTLPPETVVHCGHGPSTTIGREAATNPFVRA